MADTIEQIGKDLVSLNERFEALKNEQQPLNPDGKYDGCWNYKKQTPRFLRIAGERGWFVGEDGEREMSRLVLRECIEWIESGGLVPNTNWNGWWTHRNPIGKFCYHIHSETYEYFVDGVKEIPPYSHRSVVCWIKSGEYVPCSWRPPVEPEKPKFKHSKGPWKIEDGDIYDANGSSVADIYYHRSCGMNNGGLIAAAPEMYELIKRLTDPDLDCKGITRDARQLIDRIEQGEAAKAD